MITTFECKDCGYISATAAEFSDHIRSCPKNPLPIPTAVLERQKEDEDAQTAA